MASMSMSSATSDEARWQAVLARDPASDGAFVFAVRTTGIYCRPSCPARRPNRANVSFYERPDRAEAAGFRACKRCRPNGEGLASDTAKRVAAACRHIEGSVALPSVADLAAVAAMSPSHFQRTFKAVTGVTPLAYAEAVRTRRLHQELAAADSVTQALYAAGFSSSGRFYESSLQRLGMDPTEYRRGAPAVEIRFAVAATTLGAVLVAGTPRGLCAVLLGDDPELLAMDLQDRFPLADLQPGDEDFHRWVAVVVAQVEQPAAACDLPLDLQGTAFQRQVWEALREVPHGTTATYRDIAVAVGKPRSARAVAQACASNHLAVLVPCHRVVRADGQLSGYRWGVERKAELLRRERQPTAAAPADQ